MSFSDNKITAEMLNGKGVVGMPNTPDLPASEMQRKFDELALEVIVPAYNELCDALEEGSAEQGETISGISEKVNENTDNIAKLEAAKQDKLTAIEPLSIEETEEGTNELKVDLSEYAKTEDIPTKTSDLNNDSGFLTEHQDISGKQDKLIAGDNITIKGNVISATGGGGGGGTSNYNDLTNKPSINGKTLANDMSSEELGLQNKMESGEGISIRDSGFATTIFADTTYKDASSVEWTRESQWYGDYTGIVHFDELYAIPKRIITRINCDIEALLSNALCKIKDFVYIGQGRFTLSNEITLIKKSSEPNPYNTVLFEFNEENLTATVTLLDMNWNDKADKTEIPTISVTPITTSGTHIADITVNGTKEELYAPTGGGDDIRDELWKRDRPYFVFIDDDGREEFKNIYTNILKPRNIKAGLSICFSDYLLGSTGYLSVAELKEYEAQGNDILCHSTSIDTLVPNTADAVLRYCISQLKKYEFSNNGIFVYPNGNIGEDRIAIEEITSNYFNYGINVNYEHNCPVKIPIDNKFNIGRIFINSKNLNTDDVKQYISEIIDDTFENNKLLIISTHSNKCDTEYLAEVLDTIINRGGIFESPVAVFKDLERTYVETQLNNRNLLDNPFLNVNSRNIPLFQHYEFHRNDSAYLLDRWRCRGGDMMVTDAGLSVSAIGNYSDDHIAGMIAQYFEKDLPSGTYTFTIKADGIVHTITFEHDSSRETELLVGEKFTLLIGELYLTMGDVFVDDIQPVPALEIIYNVNSPTVINAVKLERGSVSTFENDVAPDINKEAHKCMLSKADADDDYANKEFADKAELNSKADVSALATKADVSALETKADKTQLSNRNLLDNAWFTVNQRSQTSYNANAYTVDRWFLTGTSSLTVNDGHVTLTPKTTYANIYQFFEYKPSMAGKRFTMSIEVSADATVNKQILLLQYMENGTTEKTVAQRDVYPTSNKQIFTLTFTMPTLTTNDKPKFRFGNMTVANEPIKIYRAKLEEGEISTLANDSEPNYSEELMKCKRYYQRILYGMQNYCGMFFANSSTSLIGTVNLQVPMATIKRVVYSGDVKFYDGSSAQAINSITFSNANDAQVRLNCGGSFTSGKVGTLFANSDSAYIEVSADL